MPYELSYIDYQDEKQDLTKIFIDEEYLQFPTSKHDDMLDCLARIKDPDLMASFPLKDEWEGFDEWDDDTGDRDSTTGY